MTSKPGRAVSAPQPPSVRRLTTVPAMSEQLRTEIERFMEGGEFPGRWRATDTLIAEAASVLPAMDAILKAPPYELVDAWMMELTNAVANPPNRADYELRLKAVYFALGDLPAGCWSFESMAEAMRHFKFWPSVADLNNFLRPRGDRLRQLRGNLQTMADAKPFVPARAAMSADEAERLRRYEEGAAQIIAEAEASGRMPRAEEMGKMGARVADYLSSHEKPAPALAPQVERYPALRESIRRGREAIRANPNGVAQAARQTAQAPAPLPSSTERS